MSRRFGVVAWIALVAGSPVAGVTARQPGPTGAPSAPPTLVEADAFASRAIARLAVLDLRSPIEPDANDYAIALALLQDASLLTPADAELARRVAEAAWSAGDQEALLAATRRVVELDPRDTVAQLRLLTAGIAGLQTAGERLTAYGRALGPPGAKLDPAVRSRLALDAALLERERGNQAAFVDRLSLALALDGTNKDAAVLAYHHFGDGRRDPLSRLELLSNLLYADPVDPKTHLALRDELVGLGAAEAARRFHTLGIRILTGAGAPPNPRWIVETLMLEWRLEGPATALAWVTTRLGTEREQAAQQLLRSEDVRLDSEFERVRASAAAALADGPALEASIGDMIKSASVTLDALGDVTRRPREMTDVQAAKAAGEVKTDLAFWVLLSGFSQGEEGRAELDAAEKLLEGDPVRARALRAWRLFRDGDAEAALAAAGEPDAYVWSDLVRAASLEAVGRTAEAAAAYERSAAKGPLSALGTLAAGRAAALRGVKFSAPGGEIGRRASAYADTIPPWIDAMFDHPRTVQALTVEHERARAGAIEPVGVRVRMRNLAPIPMGLGSARSINSRLLFNPGLEIGSASRGDEVSAEIIELDRRLRLLPNEILDAVVFPDAGVAGAVLERGASSATRLRWRVVQGFQAVGIARFAGPGCVEASTGTLAREALPEARLAPEELARLIAAADDDAAPALAVALRVLLSGPADGSAAGAVAALAARYPSLGPTARATVVATVPSAARSPVAAPLDEAVRAERDPRVLGAAIVSRVTTADDPLLTTAESARDPRAARIAALHRARLAAGRPTFATTSAPLTPP